MLCPRTSSPRVVTLRLPPRIEEVLMSHSLHSLPNPAFHLGSCTPDFANTVAAQPAVAYRQTRRVGHELAAPMSRAQFWHARQPA